MRNDRRSAMDQWGRDPADALVTEPASGLDSLASPMPSGAARVRRGAGRGGSAVDPAGR